MENNNNNGSLINPYFNPTQSMLGHPEVAFRGDGSAIRGYRPSMSSFSPNTNVTVPSAVSSSSLPSSLAAVEIPTASNSTSSIQLYNGNFDTSDFLKFDQPNGGSLGEQMLGAAIPLMARPNQISQGAGLILLGTAGVLALNDDQLKAKMKAEIDRIAAKVPGPQGVQYSLRATRSGAFPCYTCIGGTVNLNIGDVWKYGESINPASRYSQGYLRAIGVQMFHEFPGNQVEIKIAEKTKIYGYFFSNGHLPLGNRIFR